MYRKLFLLLIIMSLTLPAIPASAQESVCTKDQVLEWRNAIITTYTAENEAFVDLPDVNQLMELNAFELVEAYQGLTKLLEAAEGIEFAECLTLLHEVLLAALYDVQTLIELRGNSQNTAELVQQGEFLEILLDANREIGFFAGYLVGVGFDFEVVENFWTLEELQHEPEAETTPTG